MTPDKDPEGEVWFADLSGFDAGLPGELQELSRALAGNGVELPQESDRQHAHVLLRALLVRWCGASLATEQFVYNAHGKPALPAPAPAFSMAHTGRYALLAVARLPTIGIDMEGVRIPQISAHRRDGIEQLAAALGEAPLPSRDSANERFTVAWCRIEAAAKAAGNGLAPLLQEAGLSGLGSRTARTANEKAELIRTAVSRARLRVFDVSISKAPFVRAALAMPRASPQDAPCAPPWITPHVVSRSTTAGIL